MMGELMLGEEVNIMLAPILSANHREVENVFEKTQDVLYAKV